MTHTSKPPPESEPPSSDDAPASEPSVNEQKKERVLHTRIPAVLEQELKTLAGALRVPVSNLVRTILEDAVNIADRASEKVEDRLNRVARTMHDERGRIKERVQRSDSLSDVVAYQSVVMAVDGNCARCDAELPVGEQASLAIQSRPGPARFVCADCLPKH